MNTQDKPIVKRVVFLTAVFILLPFILQYLFVEFAFASIGLAAFIPPFYLNWATGVPVDELCLKSRAKDIDLQLAINACVYAVIFAPLAYRQLKKRRIK
jgi:hypothetical protein